MVLGPAKRYNVPMSETLQVESVPGGATGAARGASAPMQKILLNGTILLVIVLILAAAMVIARRLLTRRPERVPGLSLDGLAEMRRKGELSPEEYRRLRRVVLGVPDRTSPSESDDAELSVDRSPASVPSMGETLPAETIPLESPQALEAPLELESPLPLEAPQALESPVPEATSNNDFTSNNEPSSPGASTSSGEES